MTGDRKNLPATDELEERDEICQYCHNWKWQPSLAPMSYDDWVTGISQSPCLRCRIMVRAIQKLEPDFLEIKSRTPLDISYMGTFMNGRLMIDTRPRVRTVEIQLFSTSGKYAR